MNAPTAYNSALYQSAVSPYANPDRLAATAHLLGFKAAPLAGARVLQIGEHIASNMVPLAAAHPDAQFVGIELGAGPAAELPLADMLGLSNLQIRAASPDRLGELITGRFHYVLCAGAYGRRTPLQRSALLHAVADCLAPDGGLVYLGYPCLPGGHWHAALADMLRHHVGALTDPAQRAAQTRALLAFLAEANPAESPYGNLLRQAKAQCDLMSDLQIELDYLAAPAAPIALTDLLETAAPAGLAYLGDVDLPSMTDGDLPESVRSRLRGAAADPLRHEQYLDFVRGRAYRHTLLTAKGAASSRNITPDRLAGLAVASPARPAAANVNLTEGAQEDFQHPRGATLHVKHAISKAALALLAQRWPQAVPFDELLSLAAADCLLPDAEAARGTLGTDLLGYFANGLLELHIAPLPLTVDIGAQPRTWPLARLQAQPGHSGPAAWVTNLRHENVAVDAFSREVLGHLDGQHDRPALVEHLRTAVRDGRLEAREKGEPVTDPGRIEVLLLDGLDLALRRLAASGLLQ